MGLDQRNRISWRVFVLTIFLIPVVAYWMARRGQDGIMSLAVPPVVFVFLLALFNYPFARWLKILIFPKADLAVLWAVLAVSAGIACEWGWEPVGLSGFLIWLDNPSNRFRELILPDVPSWLINDYKDALEGYFGGHRTYDLYRLDHILSWLIPALGWSGLIIVLVFLMLCILLLLGPRWLEQERLSYPVATVPLYLVSDGYASKLLRNKGFWLGFSLAGLYDGIYGLSFWWRGATFQPWKGLNIGDLIVTRPWNVIGWTPIPLLPFMIALTYFIPSDLAFSSVLFFWFRKAQQIIAVALGHQVDPLWGGMAGAAKVPYLTEQSVGALTALFFVYLWHSKAYLSTTVKEVFHRQIHQPAHQSPQPTQSERSDEWRPLLRFGLIGSVIGFLLLSFLVIAMKSNTIFLLVYLVIFLAISTAVSKIRAQIGPPIHEFAFMGANRWFIDLLGADRLGSRVITIMAYLYFTHRIWRSHPMPQMADGFKVAYESGSLNMGFVSAMIMAIVWGSFAMYWSQLQRGYKWGSGAPWGYASWISEWKAMKQPNYVAAAFGVGGGLFTLLLVFLHNRFPSLPIHPAAYALGMNFGVDYCWFPMLLAGLFKIAVVRYLGQKAYHSLIPLAIGIILGEFCVGSVWSWIWIIKGLVTYSFSIN